MNASSEANRRILVDIVESRKQIFAPIMPLGADFGFRAGPWERFVAALPRRGRNPAGVGNGLVPRSLPWNSKEISASNLRTPLLS